jgi:predicted flavoprotein YhiN
VAPEPIGSADGALGWRIDGTLRVDGAPFTLRTQRVIVATGGLSVPTTGSRGFGLELAAALGHRIVRTVPALAPLVSERPLDLAGVTLPATLFLEDKGGRVLERATGSMLFTHEGVTGPAPLDISGAVEQAVADSDEVALFADLWGPADPASAFGEFLDDPKLPGACLRPALAPSDPADLERRLTDSARDKGRAALGTFLTRRLPRRVVQALIAEPQTPLAALTRAARRDAARAVCRLPLAIRGSSGYAKAEVTAGGVDLADVERRSLESRVCPGLHFCGEVLDVTGRLGGFNFQWAWTSGYLAGRGASVVTATS